MGKTLEEIGEEKAEFMEFKECKIPIAANPLARFPASKERIRKTLVHYLVHTFPKEPRYLYLIKGTIDGDSNTHVAKFEEMLRANHEQNEVV